MHNDTFSWLVVNWETMCEKEISVKKKLSVNQTGIVRLFHKFWCQDIFRKKIYSRITFLLNFGFHELIKASRFQINSSFNSYAFLEESNDVKSSEF
jgi:hypothetical protein